jgi:hypothetical protein
MRDRDSEEGATKRQCACADHTGSFVVGRTLRSPAGGFLKAGASPPSVLHFKGFRRDGFLKHRA